jgi:ribosomal protein S18 acetylase RimI-like enzyme
MTTAADTRIVDATREHIPLIAWVVLMSHRSQLPRGMWDFMLGEDEEYKLRYLEAWVDTDLMHWGHWSLFKVAEVDGVPAAALCGYPADDMSVETVIRATAMTYNKFGVPMQEAAAAWERARAVERIEIAHAPGAWVVEHVATRPDFRRRGLVDRLIAEILQRGLERGHRLSEIGLFIGNERAQQAYTKAGFEVAEEKRDPEFEAVYGCPGGLLMRRAI